MQIKRVWSEKHGKAGLEIELVGKILFCRTNTFVGRNPPCSQPIVCQLQPLGDQGRG